ncbi:MAG TPA: hypothetical protein VGM25_17000 [Caulobacteraceae bacterium]|jgi:hypothetical protein
MYFLLNDAVLNLHGEDLAPAALARRFGSVGFDYVQMLGQELFAEFPLLQHELPERALKLAALINAKQPAINAALFVAPARGCRPDQVGVRFASLDLPTLGNLQKAHATGTLDAVFADREVWRRLAA